MDRKDFDDCVSRSWFGVWNFFDDKGGGNAFKDCSAHFESREDKGINVVLSLFKRDGRWLFQGLVDALNDSCHAMSGATAMVGPRLLNQSPHTIAASCSSALP